MAVLYCMLYVSIIIKIIWGDEAVSCCVLFDNIEKLEACYSELKDNFTMIPYRTGLIERMCTVKALLKELLVSICIRN